MSTTVRKTNIAAALAYLDELVQEKKGELERAKAGEVRKETEPYLQAWGKKAQDPAALHALQAQPDFRMAMQRIDQKYAGALHRVDVLRDIAPALTAMESEVAKSRANFDLIRKREETRRQATLAYNAQMQGIQGAIKEKVKHLRQLDRDLREREVFMAQEWQKIAAYQAIKDRANELVDAIAKAIEQSNARVSQLYANTFDDIIAHLSAALGDITNRKDVIVASLTEEAGKIGQDAQAAIQRYMAEQSKAAAASETSAPVRGTDTVAMYDRDLMDLEKLTFPELEAGGDPLGMDPLK